MPVFKGTSAIAAIMLASTAIGRVYAGDTLVFDSSAGGGVEPPERALVQKSAGQSVTTTEVVLAWGAEAYDIGGWHDNTTNNSRLTTLVGVSLARVIHQLQAAGSDNATYHRTFMNGASFPGRGYGRVGAANTATPACNLTTAPITIGVPGTDYFTASGQTASGNYTPGTNSRNWFFIENLDPDLEYITARNGSNFATNNGTATLWSFDTKTGSELGWHSGGNPTRLQPTVAGWYRITGNLLENNVASQTFLKVKKNGADTTYGVPARQMDNAGGDGLNFASAPIYLNGTTDYLEVEVWTTGASHIVAGDDSWVCLERITATHQWALVRKSNDQGNPAATTAKVFWDTVEQDSGGIVQTSQSTVTITIATPGVVSWVGHGLLDGDPVKFTTTGALPTGLVANTVYYVRNKTADDFQLSASPTGGTIIATSGSQSGVHTCTSRTKLLAPAGATEARITFNIAFSASTGGIDFSNTGATGWVTKNNADWVGMPCNGATSGGTRYVGAVSAWVPIDDLTDIFQLLAHPSNSISRNITANNLTWLCAEFR